MPGLLLKIQGVDKIDKKKTYPGKDQGGNGAMANPCAGYKTCHHGGE